MAGTKVFVCENLSFTGDFAEFRWHTKGLNVEDMEFLAYRAMKKMAGTLTRFQAWHEGLYQIELSEQDAKILRNVLNYFHGHKTRTVSMGFNYYEYRLFASITSAPFFSLFSTDNGIIKFNDIFKPTQAVPMAHGYSNFAQYTSST